MTDWKKPVLPVHNFWIQKPLIQPGINIRLPITQEIIIQDAENAF